VVTANIVREQQEDDVALEIVHLFGGVDLACDVPNKQNHEYNPTPPCFLLVPTRDYNSSGAFSSPAFEFVQRAFMDNQEI